MGEVIGLVAVIGFFTSVIVIAYLFLNSRHKIRMALIQHGQDATIFREDKDIHSALKYGMVAVGVGAGLFLGGIFNRLGMEEGPAFFGPMLVLGGAGLILYYFMLKKKKGMDEIV